MTAFERILAIDWSGAATEADGVNLAVVEAQVNALPSAVHPPGGRRKWTRAACRELLRAALTRTAPRTLVLIDAGFSYPAGSDHAPFGVRGWRPLVREIAALYGQHGTARAVALAINGRFSDGGPFRFDESRSNLRFFTRHGVAYWRQVDAIVPQAISMFYMGSGGKVGFHTITFLAALDELMRQRDGEHGLDFLVWPHESFVLDLTRHAIVECYPALYPRLEREPGEDVHHHDARRVAAWASSIAHPNFPDDLFTPREVRFARHLDLSWEDQLRFEGWIAGVPWPR